MLVLRSSIVSTRGQELKHLTQTLSEAQTLICECKLFQVIFLVSKKPRLRRNHCNFGDLQLQTREWTEQRFWKEKKNEVHMCFSTIL